jgi:hypothetical protein
MVGLSCVLLFFDRTLQRADRRLQDFDGGFIGQSVSQALGSNQGSQSRVTWTVIPATNFPGGPQQLLEAVRNEHIWTAVASKLSTVPVTSFGS